MPNGEILNRLAQGDFRIAPDGPRRHRPARRTMFRKIGVIHGDYRYDVVMRDLSRTGAKIEGLVGVPVDTQLVLDLGNGQLAVSRVVRTVDAVLGVEFETPLISDGAGGLCTRHRVSPYVLAAAGMPTGTPVAGYQQNFPGNAPGGTGYGETGQGQANGPRFVRVQPSKLLRRDQD